MRDIGGRSPEGDETIVVRRVMRMYRTDQGVITGSPGGWRRDNNGQGRYAWLPYEELPEGELVEFVITGLPEISKMVEETCRKAYNNASRKSTYHGMVVKSRRSLGTVSLPCPDEVEFNVIVTGELEYE